MTNHAATALACALTALLCPAPITAQVTWWDKSFDDALTAAADKPTKLALIYFWQDSNQCALMYDGTMADARVQTAMADFLCMGIKQADDAKPYFERYKVQQMPTVLFLAPDGSLVDLVVGNATIEEFVADLTRVRAGTETLPALKQAFEAGSADLKTMQRLMQKLRQCSDLEGANKVIQAVIDKDPKGKSPEAAEAILNQICDKTFAADIAPADYDMTELRQFLKSQRNKRIKFLGYDRMAAGEYRRGDLKEAAEAVEQAWKNIPDDELIGWANQVLGIVYQRRDDIEKVNKALLKKALMISKDRIKAVAALQKKQKDDAFHADAMYLHAAILLINRKRSDALDLMEEAIALAPKSEYLKKQRDSWLSGEK